MKPEPLDNRVLIKPDELEKQSSGGIYIPDTATQYDKKRSGVVIAHGKGHVAEQTGEFIPITVSEGCRVMFPNGAGQPIAGLEIGMDDEEYLLLRENDIDFIMGYSEEFSQIFNKFFVSDTPVFKKEDIALFVPSNEFVSIEENKK